MQEEDFNLFDDRVRSLLDGGELKAPRGVWRAVRSSLDAASSWWKWAAAGLAACALAAGLLLTGTRDRGDALVSGPAVAQSVAPDAEFITYNNISSQQQSEEQPASGMQPASGKQPASTEARPAPAAVSEVEEVSVTAAESVPEAAPASPAEPESPAVSEPSRKESAAPAEADPFALMALEDRLAAERGKSRLALAFIGSASGNDSDLGTYMGRGARMADGADIVRGTGITEQSASAYGIPLSLGIGVRYSFTPRLSLGAGLNWSMLTRTFTGSYDGTTGDVDHTMHYVGIPLNIYFNALQTSDVKFYVFAGGSAEYCVSNSYVFRSDVRQATLSEPVKGLQYSVAAGLGVEFRISESIGLYFDPSARYYPSSGHPRSVRTDKPFMANFEAGLRLNL